jgi:hypothetical protein
MYYLNKEKWEGRACSAHGERKIAYLDLAGNLRAIYGVEGEGVGCRMRLKLIFKKWDGRNELDWSSSKYVQDFIECGEFFN